MSVLDDLVAQDFEGQMPGSGLSMKTFSTVSTVLDSPPGVERLPSKRPLLPQ